MRINCGELDPGAVIRPVLGEWRPHIPERLDEEELVAALTIGARLAIADA